MAGTNPFDFEAFKQQYADWIAGRGPAPDFSAYMKAQSNSGGDQTQPPLPPPPGSGGSAEESAMAGNGPGNQPGPGQNDLPPPGNPFGGPGQPQQPLGNAQDPFAGQGPQQPGLPRAGIGSDPLMGPPLAQPPLPAPSVDTPFGGGSGGSSGGGKSGGGGSGGGTSGGGSGGAGTGGTGTNNGSMSPDAYQKYLNDLNTNGPAQLGGLDANGNPIPYPSNLPKNFGGFDANGNPVTLPAGGGGLPAPGTNGPGTGYAQKAQQEAANNAAMQQGGMTGNPNLNGYGSPAAGNLGQGGSPSGGVPGGGIMGGGLPQYPGAYNPGLFSPAPLNAQGQQFLGNVFSSFQDAQNKANAANAGMYGNIQSGYNQLGGAMANANAGLGNLYGNRTNDFASGAANVLGNYGSLLNSQTQGNANIGSGYNALLNNQMGRLGLLGQTQAMDINQAYNQQQAGAQQDLVNRGLGNTTVQQAVNRGINLDQTRALTNNAQNVAQTMNSTEMGAALPMLQQQTQALGQQANIAGQGLQAQQSFLPQVAGLQGQALDFGNQAVQNQTQLGQNQLNFMQGVNQTGPDFSTLANLATAIGTGGTGPGTNGFNNLPSNFPSQNPVGPLPGANLTPAQSPQQPGGQLPQLPPPPGFAQATPQQAQPNFQRFPQNGFTQ